jgi:Mn2+/Fe2+ NRAMP family transporter
MTQTNAARNRIDLKSVGPGIITGAADDDPSGIATYAQAGAQFGYALLWTVWLTLPFMIAIQLVSARIGRVTGKGIAANLLEIVPRPFVVALVVVLVLANTFNIAADLAAMGDALQLIAGGYEHVYALGFGLLCMALQVWIPYRRYAPFLGWLTASLFAYVATAFMVTVPWGDALTAIVAPRFSADPDYLLAMVAVFGTTISPYLFFWQAANEIEVMKLHRGGRRPLRELKSGGDGELRRIAFDTGFGMTISNIVAFFIIVTTAATLHAAGVTDIQSSAQAAEALRPLAGDFAFALFSLGIIGTGLLAVPVLAGAAAYAAADVFGWVGSLGAKPKEAVGFYGLIAFATLCGVAIDFTPLDPIRMLFWSAVINGLAAAPIMAAMMLIVTHRAAMGRFRAHPALIVSGWVATLLMFGAAGALIWTSVF